MAGMMADGKLDPAMDALGWAVFIGLCVGLVRWCQDVWRLVAGHE